MKIAGYLRTSLIEWPEKISSVVFVPGCNFRCPFCHNAGLVDPEKIKKLSLTPEKEVLTDLQKRKKWIDGVVVTGGEPTLQSDLPEFLKKLKNLGFETMIQTNGSKPEVIHNLIKRKLVGYLTLDLKGNFEDYNRFAGVKKCQSKIKKSLKIISESGINFELRTTVVPTLHDQENLIRLAREIKNKNLVWYLQDFQPKNCLNPAFKKIKPFSKIELEKFLKAVRKIIPGAKIRD